ncbi:unnamed protein product [Aphanomyces euteiches]
MNATRAPVVLIHGIFGWGVNPRPLFDLGPCYWPIDDINELNPNNIIVQVGPVSFDHDRACEAFYQVFGGRVDYGEEHSRQYGHSRYSRTYEAAHPTWSEENPVHLLGHSFGGTTALELYQLICHDFFGVGTNYKWVKSITTPVPYFSGAHFLAAAVMSFWKASVTVLPVLKHVFDYQLDQWKDVATWDVLYSPRNAILYSQDNALYTGMPAFRVKRNQALVHMDKVHLFSIVASAKDQHKAPTWEVASLIGMLYVLNHRRKLWPAKFVQATAWVVIVTFTWKKLSIVNFTKARATLCAFIWAMRYYVYSKTEHGTTQIEWLKGLYLDILGLDQQVWVHNDGLVNTHSQVYPRVALNPKETNDEVSSSSSMVRNASYVSVDLANLGAEDDDIVKGQWHIHRVEKNHLRGPFLDPDAKEMYKHIFKLLQKTGLPKLVAVSPVSSAAVAPVTPPSSKLSIVKPAPLLARKSSSSTSNPPIVSIQARIEKVTVSHEGFAKYLIVSSLWPNGPTFTIERRYREFFSFASRVSGMLTPNEMLKFPPKTYCTDNLTDGFLVRRKLGLEAFLGSTIDLLMNPNAKSGPPSKRTMTQMHVLRDFLGLPAARDVQGAICDVKRLGSSLEGWYQLYVYGPQDRLYSASIDGFSTFKRIATMPFPPRAVLDAIMLPPAEAAKMNPSILGGAVLRKESTSLWVEHVIRKTLWLYQQADFVNVKSWRVEPDGTILVVSVPGSAQDCPLHVKPTATTVLQGWILEPLSAAPNSTQVTMVMQVDLERIHIGPRSSWNQIVLLCYMQDVGHIQMHLEKTFDADYYAKIGPVVSLDELKSLPLEAKDAHDPTSTRDPKVYLVCQQIEPLFCLLIHKNTNRNALVVKLNIDEEAQQVNGEQPLLGEWIMFEKAKNPRQPMSVIERNTTYQWKTKMLGQGVYAVEFGILKGRSFQLRLQAGYFLHGTVNGKPNTMVKRFYLTFAPSVMGLGQLTKVDVVGETETESVFVR